MSESAIYRGSVSHCRHVPKKHAFRYDIFLFWLHLDELDELTKNVTGFSHNSRALVRFRREDYLGPPTISLKQAVLSKMTELHGSPLDGDVFLLGQVRMLGVYFSPVNFYFLRDQNQQFTYMLAEVSNTPWNERHCYLVDLASQDDCQKQFHVSPFNPMDMTYRWRVKAPGETFKMVLSCLQETRHFDAALDLRRVEMNSTTLRRVMVSIPSMTIKTVVGIYWQALKLFIKRVPFYSHPTDRKEQI
ncbi:DUF1365 domain-containing protein [Aestuariibacter salexigens]|uniref:DUF1365 domain-containing protein n=1 Tax=Aestuariibacter salexigens TaxID=226010 RepID=UPI00041A50F2|nr:DUF1365 domain-containing protein [Aestuariibacter salexigens]